MKVSKATSHEASASPMPCSSRLPSYVLLTLMSSIGLDGASRFHPLRAHGHEADEVRTKRVVDEEELP